MSVTREKLAGVQIDAAGVHESDAKVVLVCPAMARCVVAGCVAVISTQPVRGGALPVSAPERECWLERTRECTRGARLEFTA